MPSRNPSSKPGRGTSLDRRQEALRKAEEEVRLKMENAQRILKEAPKRREEVLRRQREEYNRDSRFTPPEEFIFRGQTTRKLRSERHEGRWIFLLLVIVLGGMVIWIIKLLS